MTPERALGLEIALIFPNYELILLEKTLFHGLTVSSELRKFTSVQDTADTKLV